MQHISNLAGRLLLTSIFALAVSVTAGTRSANAQAGGYTIDGNGFQGNLEISIDGSGNVSGTVYGNPIFGFYDDASRHIIFERVINQNDLTQNQVFDGYIWAEYNSPSGCFEYAGTFQFFSGTGGTPVLYKQGWWASADACNPIQ